MNIINKIKERYPWKEYFIVLTIVSFGSYIIHARFNNPINLNQFFSWLPLVWLLVLILMIIFCEFLGERK